MNVQPFVFVTERRLVLLTGLRACNLSELVEHLRAVTGSSVFYHTHHQFLSHHFERPSFHNDFSLWVSSALLEERLSEKLAALNLLAYTSVRQIRESMIAAIEEHFQANDGPRRECVAGQEFHFCESQSFVLPTGIHRGAQPGEYGLALFPFLRSTSAPGAHDERLLPLALRPGRAGTRSGDRQPGSICHDPGRAPAGDHPAGGKTELTA
jgi:hypothetical protein